MRSHADGSVSIQTFSETRSFDPSLVVGTLSRDRCQSLLSAFHDGARAPT